MGAHPPGPQPPGFQLLPFPQLPSFQPTNVTSSRSMTHRLVRESTHNKLYTTHMYISSSIHLFRSQIAIVGIFLQSHTYIRNRGLSGEEIFHSVLKFINKT